MKSLFLLVIFLPFLSKGQLAILRNTKKVDLKFKTDTLSYEGRIVKLYRTTNLSDYCFKGGNQNFDLDQAVTILEDDITNLSRYVRTNQTVYTKRFKEDLASIKRVSPDFDTHNYEQELEFYNWYNDDLARKKAVAKAYEDSLSIVQNAQAQKAFNYSDSVRKVQEDSIYSINQKRQEKEAAAFKAECIKKFGKVITEKILYRQVEIGMTKDMCEYSWGTPETTNETLVGGVKLETWVYDLNRWLIFKNGILKSITK